MSTLTGHITAIANEDGTGKCEWQFNGYGISVVAPIVIGWYSGWAFETRTYIVSDMIGHWYWTGMTHGDRLRPVKRGQSAHATELVIFLVDVILFWYLYNYAALTGSYILKR